MDTITRSVPFEVDAVRVASDGDGLTLAGYAAVFNSPTRIRGEGPDFDEVIAPGAFARTIRAKTPVLMFDHGQHPLVGSLPIGSITKLREDARGLYVEARLADNWLVQPVRDAIAGGGIDGMSFRFNVPKGKDSWDRSGDTPLRTLREVNCAELGPVVFPAYTDTSVAVRSLVDQMDAETRDAIVDVFRQMADPDAAEDNAALAIIDQIKPLIGQLVSLEADSLQGGEDVACELSTLVSMLSSLSWYEDMTEAELGLSEEGMNSADDQDTHHEPAPDSTSERDSSEDPDPADATPVIPIEADRLRLLHFRKVG